jgi:uncharacterized protein (TIGR02266 family)
MQTKAAAGSERKHQRIEVNNEFKEMDSSIAEYVRNISRSGAFIKSSDPLPVGTRVNLRFSLILEDLETFEGEGLVVRVVPPGNHSTPGMGVRFTWLTYQTQQQLRRLLATSN